MDTWLPRLASHCSTRVPNEGSVTQLTLVPVPRYAFSGTEEARSPSGMAGKNGEGRGGVWCYICVQSYAVGAL